MNTKASVQSKHADTLNALDEMQQSMVYAVRKHVLAQAEQIIVEQERELILLKKGEFICKGCGLRKESEFEGGDF